MRIVGLRLQPSVARLLAEILEGAGYVETASKIAAAIEQRITTEAPLTLADHKAIVAALEPDCPATLLRLRQELLEELRRVRRITGG